MERSQLLSLITTAFSSLEDLVFIMEEEKGRFRYLFINDSASSVLNLSHGITGKTIEEIFPEDLAETLNQQYRKAAIQKRVISYENETILNDEQRIFQSVLTPLSIENRTYIIAIVRDVTEKNKKMQELQKAKALLEKNEQRLSALIENNEDGIFLLDTEGYLLEVNPAAELISGYHKEELIGTNFRNIMSNKEFERIKKYFQMAVLGENVRYDLYIYHKEGNEVYLSIKNMPCIVDGHIIGLYGIARDITKEKKIIEELSTVNRQLESFLNDSTDPIWITNLEGEVEFINSAFTITFGFTEEEVLNKQNPIVPEWLFEETNQLFREAQSGKRKQNLHVKRQKKSGDLIDVSITFSPVYNEFGELTGISSIGRDISQIKKNEVETMKAKEELELVWKNTTEAILMIGKNGEIIRANSAFEEMFQFNKEDMDNLKLSQIYIDYQRNQLDEFFKRLRDRKFLQFETKRKRKDGMIIEISAIYRLINNDEILAIATYKDIGEEKRIIRRMKESEKKYRKVLESTADAMIILEGEIITHINQSGLKLLRAKKSTQVIGKAISHFIHPKSRKEVTERIQQVMKNGSNGDRFEEIILSVDGDIIHVEGSSALFLEEGNISAYLMFRDITVKKRAVKALKENEERFRIIAEHSKDIIKILTPKGKITYASPSIEKLLGYPVRNMIGKNFLNQIHSEDKEDTKKIFKKISESRIDADVEIRYTHQDGSYVWLHSHFHPIISSEGEIEKVIVISGDITEIKQREEILTKMAFYDFLTGLPNRRLFIDRLKQAMYTSDRTGKLTALLMLDGDGFKQINDRFGHNIGDEVIKELAKRVRQSIRKMDTLSRVGGDEFTIVLPELNDMNDAITISERILKNSSKPMFIKGHIIQSTLSIGIAFFPTKGIDVESLYQEADLNLYKAKEQGGNTYSL